ncbi:MAG: hypothetical protein BHV89_03070 [Clostridiales bacterium 41_21_two_genomes]|nr:MAG: hypothetical protein BHV89_03070 [Clostridiales bacterium 41_21_two_genomes]
MRSILEVGSEQLCYYEERNDIGENYIIIIGKDNDNESENHSCISISAQTRAACANRFRI